MNADETRATAKSGMISKCLGLRDVVAAARWKGM